MVSSRVEGATLVAADGKSDSSPRLAQLSRPLSKGETTEKNNGAAKAPSDITVTIVNHDQNTNHGQMGFLRD